MQVITRKSDALENISQLAFEPNLWNSARHVDLKVKICGITSIDDAKAAADAGADALGFMFFPPSPRNLSIDTAAKITAHVSPFVLRVGVFVDPEPEFVFAAMSACGLNLLQFHGNESPEFCQQFGIMTMKAFRVRDAESIACLSQYRTDAYLLDSYVAGRQGGTGEKFNWDLAIDAKKYRKPIFLAGGLTPLNVADAVTMVQPYGLDVSSGVESSPGLKDHEKIQVFIREAKKAADQLPS